MHRLEWALIVAGMAACGPSTSDDPSSSVTANPTTDTTDSAATETGTLPMGPTGMTGLWALTGCTGTPTVEPGALADVEGVEMTGGPDAWTVSVTVRSPDVDCDQYASWWEIVTVDGELVYRRILNHSHADEQPFTRSSTGSVSLDADTVYRVRAHLHPAGFGGQVMEGRPGEAFVGIDVDDGWADDLLTADPLPEECWY